MKIFIAFLVACVIGACRRWTHIPFWAIEGLTGSLLIVAHLLSKQAVVARKATPAVNSNASKH